jgi:hypothetical protein
MRNDQAIWKFGSGIATVRLLALWFMVVAASNPAGWSQATGFYLSFLMLPELLILHVIRDDAPRWVAGVAILSFITSYLWAWLLLRLFHRRREN